MRRWKVPIALAVAVMAVGWLLLSGVSRNDVYMSTLEQWDTARAKRETVRLMGFVKEGSISQQSDALVTTFVMRNEKGSHEQPMRYAGVTPGLFRDGTSVVAAGRLGDDGVFAATELMTKCPSKYEGVESPHGDKAPVPPAAPITTSLGPPVGG